MDSKVTRVRISESLFFPSLLLPLPFLTAPLSSFLPPLFPLFSSFLRFSLGQCRGICTTNSIHLVERLQPSLKVSQDHFVKGLRFDTQTFCFGQQSNRYGFFFLAINKFCLNNTTLKFTISGLVVFIPSNVVLCELFHTIYNQTPCLSVTSTHVYVFTQFPTMS